MNAKILTLLKLLLNGKYSILELAEEFGTTERFIRYIIDDCDFYLRSINLPPISFSEDGIYLTLNDEQRERLLNITRNIDAYSYNLSAQERQDYILLCLLCCKEPLKNTFFSQLVNASKSTIDKDIASIKQSLEKEGIDIRSASGKGIYISGDEIDIRTAIVRLISRYFDFAKLITEQHQDLYGFLEKNIYVFLFEMYYKTVLKVVNEVDKELSVKLSFLSYKELCVYLVVMLNRLNFNQTIFIYDDYIEQTKECKMYKTSKDICKKLENELSIHISDEEISYICMILESAHYTTLEGVNTKEWAFIQIVANKLIDDVSNILHIDLISDKELVNALTLHLGITIKKLHYNIPVVNSDVSKIVKNYSSVFNAIKECVHSNSQELLSEIGDDDIAYLTLHFQAAIERKKEKRSNVNIIVVCVHGYGTASLMKEMIVSRYPNINVKRIMTRNTIDNSELDDVDFIVSSVNLPKKKCPIVKVNPILKKQDYIAIEKTIKSLSATKKEKDEDAFEEIINIISKDSEEPDDELKEKLLSYLNDLGLTTLSNKTLGLYDYLKPDNIKILDSSKDWKTAVNDVGLVLVESGAVDKEYITSIINTVESSGPYMVIDEGIAMVHGEINKHVNRTEMSLLILKEGVNFNSGRFDPVQFILCLAAKDTHSHNKALSDLLEIIEDYKTNKDKYYDVDYIKKKVREVSEA